MTDLCFAEDAQQRCEHHVTQAMTFTKPDDGKPLIDALQACASHRLSSHQDATDLMAQVYSQIKVGCQALSRLVDGETEELQNVEAADGLPNFEFRCQTATLLLETKQVAESIHVLKSLMAENDEVVQIWYLLGCAHAEQGGEDAAEVARHYWNTR